jgi:hypothetical protein
MVGRTIRVLVTSRNRSFGETLCSSLGQVCSKYQTVYRTNLDIHGLPESFDPDVVIAAFPEHDFASAVALRTRIPVAKCLIIARAPDETQQLHWLRNGIRGIIDETTSQVDFRLLDRALSEVLADILWAPRKIVSRLVRERLAAEGGAEGSPTNLASDPGIATKVSFSR